jgi:hypothetical protein
MTTLQGAYLSIILGCVMTLFVWVVAIIPYRLARMEAKLDALLDSLKKD